MPPRTPGPRERTLLGAGTVFSIPADRWIDREFKWLEPNDRQIHHIGESRSWCHLAA